MAKQRDILIKGGRIIDPAAGRDEVGDLLVRGGRVEAAGSSLGRPDGAELIDAVGLVVTPGFIDPHCHLREPGFEYKETIATGTAAAAAGGFTTVCCMANTSPPVDNKATLEEVLEIVARQATVKVLPLAAITCGLAGGQLVQMGELSEAGALAFSDDGIPLASAAVMRHALEYAERFSKTIANHCEDPVLTSGAAMNEGPTSYRLGLPATPPQAEEIMLARDIALAELTGGRYHALHVSAARSVQLIADAKERGVRVTAEVTPHHLTLTDDIVAGRWQPVSAALNPYDPVTKVNPPLRRPQDIEALQRATAEGTIDCVATDHAPHAVHEKRVEYAAAAAGISGLETAFGVLMGLVHGGVLGLPVLIERMTVGAARVYGIPHAGLAKGADADIVVFDPDEEWAVDVSAFRSKGKNTPFHGLTLRGRVLMTICRGRTVFNFSEESVEAGRSLGG